MNIKKYLYDKFDFIPKKNLRLYLKLITKIYNGLDVELSSRTLIRIITISFEIGSIKWAIINYIESFYGIDVSTKICKVYIKGLNRLDKKFFNK